MTYSNHTWSVLGRDTNSPFIRNYIWTKAFFSYPQLLEISRFVAGIVSERDNITYILDAKSWNECHEQLKKKLLNDNDFMQKIISKTFTLGESFNAWSEKNIFKKNLKTIPSTQLNDLFQTFIEKQSELYAYGVALPLLDIQKFSFVESNLTEFLKSNLSEEEYALAFTVFTHPPKNSFAQDQEEDLLKLMQQFYPEKSWIHDVKSLTLAELNRKYPLFYKKLQNHIKKHAWVYYVYAGPAFTQHQFLEFIKDYMQKGVNPSKKLKEIKENKKQIEKKKKIYIKKLKPNPFQLSILNLAGMMVWGKPRRKDYQSKSYYHFEKLLLEIARRLSLSLRQARCIPPEGLSNALNTGKVDIDLINNIYNSHACLPNDDNTISILVGKEAQQFLQSNIKEEQEKIKVNVINGSCAYHGKVTGKVTIINIPAEMAKMQQGDILVSIATTPAIVPAMKKAAAIVTDEGGLTCHAAIVSRELAVPCVVSTKIATKILKNGDWIEVDADKGVVKRLNKSVET